MAAVVSLVVTDLDGTMWDTDDDIRPDVVVAFERVQATGVPLLVATGRRVASTRIPLARVGLAPPAVVLNGALGVDLSTGDRFHRAPFTAGEATCVLAAFRAVGLDPCVYVDHPTIEVFVSATPSTNPSHLAGIARTSAVDDLDRVVADEAVLGFSLIGVAYDDLVAAGEKAARTSEVHLDRSRDYVGLGALTVAPCGQSKWSGITAFCAHHGLDAAKVLAIGDGSNDVELLEGAAIALVPDDGHPDALAVADRFVPPARDGGWLSVLDELGLER